VAETGKNRFQPQRFQSVKTAVQTTFSRNVPTLILRRLRGRQEYIVMSLKHAPDALKYPGKPEDVDHVENNTRQYEQVPHDAKLVAFDGAVDRVDLVPVRRNAGDATEEKRRRHREPVQQKQFRPTRVTHHAQEPPVDIHSGPKKYTTLQLLSAETVLTNTDKTSCPGTTCEYT